MTSRKISVNISGDIYSVIEEQRQLATTTAYMNHILREYMTMKGLLPEETVVGKYRFPLSESDYEDCKKYLDINKFSEIDTYIESPSGQRHLNSEYLFYGSNWAEAQRNVNESFMVIFEDLVKSFEVTSYDFDDILEFSKVLASGKKHYKKMRMPSVSENDALILDEDIMSLKGEPVDTRERLDLISGLLGGRFDIQYSEAEKVYKSAFKMLFNHFCKWGADMHNREFPKGFYFLVFCYVDFKLALKHKEVPLDGEIKLYPLRYCNDSDIIDIMEYVIKDITPETTTDELHQ